MSVYVRLRVASEVYAMPVANVIEVAQFGDVTAVPGSRPEILGVRNLRGLVLPVVDLAALLQIPRGAPASRMLVAAAGDQRAGFPVDEVSDVGELAEATEETESDLLLGAVLADGCLIGVIDVPRIFDAAVPLAAGSAGARP